MSGRRNKEKKNKIRIKLKQLLNSAKREIENHNMDLSNAIKYLIDEKEENKREAINFEGKVGIVLTDNDFKNAGWDAEIDRLKELRRKEIIANIAKAEAARKKQEVIDRMMNDQPPPGGWDEVSQLTEEEKKAFEGGKRKTRRRRRKRKTKKSRRKGRKTKKRRKRKTRKKRGRGKVDKKTKKKMENAKAKTLPSIRKIKKQPVFSGAKANLMLRKLRKPPIRRQSALRMFESRINQPVAASTFDMSDIQRALPQQQQIPVIPSDSDNSEADAEVGGIMNINNEQGASKE